MIAWRRSRSERASATFTSCKSSRPSRPAPVDPPVQPGAMDDQFAGDPHQFVKPVQVHPDDVRRSNEQAGSSPRAAGIPMPEPFLAGASGKLKLDAGGNPGFPAYGRRSGESDFELEGDRARANAEGAGARRMVPTAGQAGADAGVDVDPLGAEGCRTGQTCSATRPVPAGGARSPSALGGTRCPQRVGLSSSLAPLWTHPCRTQRPRRPSPQTAAANRRSAAKPAWPGALPPPVRAAGWRARAAAVRPGSGWLGAGLQREDSSPPHARAAPLRAGRRWRHCL